MCGIIGLLGNANYNNVNIIINGLSMLQNRGYDSVGISYIQNNELLTIKKASDNTNDSLNTIKNMIKMKNINSTNIIGHTRWATHGNKTDINAHPHSDNDFQISIVHNGIINNYQELKNMLIEKGYTFYSQTDTEVIAVLISFYFKEMTIIDAINKAIKIMSGTWALVIINQKYPNKMWITRNGSPLLLSINDSFALICSEQSGFCNYVNQYYAIDNHQVIELTYENNKITINNDLPLEKLIKKNDETFDLSPYPYKHWMEKEIFSQVQTALNAINNGGRINSDSTVHLGGLELHKSLLLEAEHIVILGCGTSYNAGLWASYIFKSMKMFKSVSIIDGAELTEYDIPNEKTVFIFLSQSGETRDLIKCFSIIGDNLTIGIVNVPDSEISKLTTCGVYLNAGRENAVASTKSFTSQCIVLTLIAIWYAQNKNICYSKRKQMISDIRSLELHIHNILKNHDIINNVALEISNKNSCFILGKNSSKAIALEGALKLKEITYIHAEGFSSSALKHGPFALIEKDLPIFIINVNHDDVNINAYNEILSREANVIVIGLLNDKMSKLYVDNNKTFGNVLSNIYIQLLSYKIAIIKEINPDYPRNLAKVVTVE